MLYRILVESEPFELEMKVNKLLQIGWELRGDLTTVSPEKYYTNYTQVLVKETEESV